MAETAPNPGSIARFAEANGLPINGAETTQRYTAALAAFRELCLDDVVVDLRSNPDPAYRVLETSSPIESQIAS